MGTKRAYDHRKGGVSRVVAILLGGGDSGAIMSTGAFRSLMEIPVVGAPLAGGSSTPQLAAAISDAGGLGFIAAGYKTVDEVHREIEHVQTRGPGGRSGSMSSSRHSWRRTRQRSVNTP